MKIQALIVALLALGLGFAAGSYFSPTWTHPSPEETPAPGISPTTTVASAGASFAGAGHSQATPAARPVPTLDSLLKDPSTDFYNYQRTKSMLAYVDSISPSEIGDTLQKVEKMPNSMAKFQFRYYLVMRWSDADPQGALAWSQQKRRRAVRAFYEAGIGADGFRRPRQERTPAVPSRRPGKCPWARSATRP